MRNVPRKIHMFYCFCIFKLTIILLTYEQVWFKNSKSDVQHNWMQNRLALLFNIFNYSGKCNTITSSYRVQSNGNLLKLLITNWNRNCKQPKLNHWSCFFHQFDISMYNASRSFASFLDASLIWGLLNAHR